MVTGNALQLTLALTSLQGENGDENCGTNMGIVNCEVHYSFSQTLDMPAGWSIISTYIEEQDADGNTAMVVDEIFSDISDEVIILKDYLGAAWLKEWNFNGVGSMEFGKGYQIKLNHPASITFRGHRPLAETPLELPQGWSFIGYTRTYPADPVAAFAPLVDEDNRSEHYISLVKMDKPWKIRFTNV